MKTYHLTVSTPDGNAYDGECLCLAVRGTEGELAIMAGHIPFVTSLVPSECKILTEDESEIEATLTGGVLTVGEDSVTLIAGSFELKNQ
ncbi:MAG: F0F1 ATP synthase subunit epsilon [Ruminococcaceae bacterium]|nr:F0F1 ATP synthase subunit epsilon [Oscillospiraceae bacterium]